MWKRLGLFQAPREILWMAMALALLPARSFRAALDIIQGIADVVAVEYPRVLEFVAYLRRQWLPRAHIVSAYRCAIRTNSELEAFNRQLPDRFGGTKRNIYTFLGNY